MARELYDDHFKAVESMPRGVVVTLRNISTQLESAWELHTNRQVCRLALRWWKSSTYLRLKDSRSPQASPVGGHGLTGY